MLADHHADLIHEHQLENCVHEEWQVEGIEDLVYTECFGSSYMKCEISCCFCGKTNSIHIPLTTVLELLNSAIINDPQPYSWYGTDACVARSKRLKGKDEVE